MDNFYFNYFILSKNRSLREADGFGTIKLSSIYEQNRQFDGEISQLVPPGGLEELPEGHKGREILATLKNIKTKNTHEGIFYFYAPRRT